MADFSNKSDYQNYVVTEQAILMEDIILPDLPKFPTMKEIHNGTYYYPRTEELYSDQVGKFSVPITTPFSENYSDPSNSAQTSKPVKNMNTTSLKSSNYTTSNYIELTIPKYIVLNFIGKIPKNTAFVVCFLGGGSDVEDIKIIGVC